MKKIFTLFLSLCFYSFVMGQRPEAVIAKAGDVKPVIDGVLDDVWTNVEQHNVNRDYTGEHPTLGPEGTTYWKALWDDNGMYIIIVANDDVWFPYSGTGNAYEFDKIELYFDTNYVLDDHVGGQNQATGNRQIAPDPTLDKLDGETLTQTILGGDVKYAYKVENPKWTTEWFVPWTSIPDGEGNLFDKTGTMGFDVDITDNDNDGAGRKRAMWSNIGTVAENWSNMDDAGHLTFEGAQPGIDITKITISGPATITTDNGTAQLAAVIEPANATQGYKWQVTNGTGMATVSSTGLVTALRNGTVMVKAVSSDNFVSSNELTITISGQRISYDEINLFKNGFFNKGANGLESWGVNPAADWKVEDGWLTVSPTPKTNIWDIMAYQAVDVDATTKYIVKFKAKASTDMTVPFIIEDINNNYNKTVTSTSPYRKDSYWEIPVTTEAKWYQFDVVHSAFVANSKYQPSFQVGMLNGTLYIDSLMMYKESDYALVDPKAGAKTMDANSIKVYPNPVGNGQTLFVELTNMNAKVAIYNAAGQKLIEKTADGYKATFDVSGLRQGLYFIKTDDGAVQKFVR
ncbi:MAG: sugar-binding protein [Candidatus Saccharibacteria bacterium]